MVIPLNCLIQQMKTTFTSKEITHVWAHKSAPYGKSPGAMSFNGECFLSYGTVIARHITHKGKPAIIVNDTGYSNSTSKHQNCVNRAIPGGIPVFRIGNRQRGAYLDDVSGKELFEYAIGRATEYATLAEKATKRGSQYLGQQARWLERAREVNEFFGLRRKLDEKTIERLREAAAKAERAERVKRSIREAKERDEQRIAFEAWKAGLSEGYFNDMLFPVAFRIEADELVSSRGARVPIAEAKRALAFALRHRQANWHRNGDTCPVGHYQLDAINPEGIVAGCHRITWAEVERVAIMLA